MNGKFYLLTLVLGLTTLTGPVKAAPPSAKAGAAALNVLSGVDVAEQEDGTYITLQGSQKATYSVFKLNKPLRLFVDISNSTLGQGVRRAPLQVGNGVVEQVAVLEFSDDVQQITRLIVGFDQQATYDVRTEGDKVIVFIEGSGRSQGGDGVALDDQHRRELERQEAELDRARRALNEKERRLSQVEDKVSTLEKALSAAKVDEGRAVLQKALEAERAKAEQLRGELSERESRASDLQGAIEAERRRSGDLQETIEAERRLTGDLQGAIEAERRRSGDLEAHLKAERLKAESLKEAVASLTRDQERLAVERDQARKEAEARTKERDQARKDSDRLTQDSKNAREQLEGLEKSLTQAQAELARTESARKTAIGDAEKLRAEIQTVRSQVTTQDKDAEGLRRQVAMLNRARDEARDEARGGDKGAEERASRLEADLKSRTESLVAMERKLKAVTADLDEKEKALDTSIARARALEADKARAEREASRVSTAREAQVVKARSAEDQRVEALEKARQAEQERLVALEKARTKEEQRLEALEKASQAEQERLASVKNARAEEEAHLAALKKEVEQARKDQKSLEEADAKAAQDRKRAQEEADAKAAQDRKRAEKDAPSEVAAIDSRLTQVKEQGDKAEVTLKQEAGSAVVETANTVKAVRFQQKGEISRIIIELDRPGNFETVPWNGGKASLVIDGVLLPKSLERTLDTQAFGGTVRYVSSYREKSGAVRVDAHVPSATTEIVRQDGSRLFWEFTSVGAGDGLGTPENDPALSQADGPARPSGFTSAPPNFGGASAARRTTVDSSVPPWQRRPTRIARKRITIDLRGADVQNVLRLIAREGNINIVAGTNVTGSVTMKLDNVLLTDAFVTILKSLSLGYEQDGEVIRVAPSKEFEEAALKRREDIIASFPLEPLEVVLMPLNYANAQQVNELVKTVLSSRGTVSVDARTNTLVIKDVAQNLAAAQQLIISLDAQTPQILIEARIVETNDQFARQFGIQWGGDFLFAPANGNPTGLVFPSVVGVAGAATDAATPLAGIVGTPNFAVNLPAAIGTGSGGGLGITLGSLGGAGNLALRLSALENDGHIKIVSAPRIMTLDNVAAAISTGTSIPISVVSAAGVQTVFVEANLQLNVTPHVTQDGNVVLDLNIEKSEPDFANTGAAGDPSIIRRSARTQLLVGDGDTTVIGGIFAHTSATGTNKVPFFADIPILGFFFRDYSENENRSELLIFVTPRIVNRESSMDARRLNPIDAPDIGGGGGGGGQ